MSSAFPAGPYGVLRTLSGEDWERPTRSTVTRARGTAEEASARRRTACRWGAGQGRNKARRCMCVCVFVRVCHPPSLRVLITTYYDHPQCHKQGGNGQSSYVAQRSHGRLVEAFSLNVYLLNFSTRCDTTLLVLIHGLFMILPISHFPAAFAAEPPQPSAVTRQHC